MTPQLPEGCVERRRIEAAEVSVGMVKDQLLDIKDTLHNIESEVRRDLSGFSSQFGEFSASMQTIMVKLEERDRRSQEIMLENKESFNRLAADIRAHSDRMGTLEVKTAKIDTLEKLVYGALMGIGGMFGWLLQKALS